MEKQTLSNYGWIVVVTLVLSVMLALATPFGTYVGDGVVSIANGMVSTSDNAMNEDNIASKGQEWESKLNSVLPPEELIAQGIIPEGGTYTSADGTVYNAGDTMPTIANGDTYTYRDYIYTYHQNNESYIDGWEVFVLDGHKTEYGAILESINGKPVTSMHRTFQYCFNLTTAPIIPNTVINMDTAFMQCVALTTAPVIPSSVTSMNSTFSGCTSLETPPDMSNAINVTNMKQTFFGCTSLTGNIEINAIPSNYDGCFDNTTQSIHITGSCSNKAELVATSKYWNGNEWLIKGNVTY